MFKILRNYEEDEFRIAHQNRLRLSATGKLKPSYTEVQPGNERPYLKNAGKYDLLCSSISSSSALATFTEGTKGWLAIA
jgi:hypothetical protein